MSKPSDRFHTLLGKALVDAEYRMRVLDPAQQVAVLKELGIARPTKKQILALNNAIQTLKTLYGTFGEGVGAA